MWKPVATLPSTLFAVMMALQAAPTLATDQLSKSWQQVLSRHLEPSEEAGVRFVGIDYAALAQGDIDFYTALFELAATESFGLGPADEMALLINAYNILAVQVVVESWPLGSIKDASSVYGSVWNRPAGDFSGESITLAALEEQLELKRDPRFHFAIVCASKSCPDLRTEPYTGTELDAQLDDQLRSFLDDPTKGLRFDASTSTLFLSRLFEWYADEFEQDASSVLDFVLDACDPTIAAAIRSQRAQLEIEYIPYDWSLNSLPSALATPGSR